MSTAVFDCMIFLQAAASDRGPAFACLEMAESNRTPPFDPPKAGQTAARRGSSVRKASAVDGQRQQPARFFGRHGTLPSAAPKLAELAWVAASPRYAEA